jgi:choline-glycine betaine transporter
MSGVARSMQIWAIYATVVGLALLLIPNTLIGIFQIEETTEVWVRVVGGVVLVLTVLYWHIVSEGSRRMFQATVYGRGLFVVVAAVLAFTTGPWQLILFAIVDAAGALWTYMANRQTRPDL